MGMRPPSDIEGKLQPRRGESTFESEQMGPSSGSDYRPFRKWIPWLVPGFVVTNVIVFAISMYINNCPKHSESCVAGFLGRFSFQPFKENPLLGPSSTTLSGETDRWRWAWEKSGKFSVNAMYNQIAVGRGRPVFHGSFPVSLVWRKEVPSKICVFWWKIVWNRLPTDEHFLWKCGGIWTLMLDAFYVLTTWSL